MIVELRQVTGPNDKEGEPIGINPAHVVQVRRGVNASNPDAQAFVTELTLVVGGTLKVAGSRTDVTNKLNGGRN